MANTTDVEFIDCTSLAINYDIMGIATVTFTVVSNTEGIKYKTSVAGFSGYVTNVTCTPIINTSGWYLNNVTLIATKSAEGA